MRWPWRGWWPRHQGEGAVSPVGHPSVVSSRLWTVAKQVRHSPRATRGGRLAKQARGRDIRHVQCIHVAVLHAWRRLSVGCALLSNGCVEAACNSTPTRRLGAVIRTKPLKANREGTPPNQPRDMRPSLLLYGDAVLMRLSSPPRTLAAYTAACMHGACPWAGTR